MGIHSIGVESSEKSDFSLSQQLWSAVSKGRSGLKIIYLISARILAGLILFKTCVCQNVLCGFVSLTVISCSDDSNSQHYPSSYLLYASSCRMFPEPWLGEDCNNGSFSGLKTQCLMLSTFQESCFSALITVPQIKKLF